MGFALVGNRRMGKRSIFQENRGSYKFVDHVFEKWVKEMLFTY